MRLRPEPIPNRIELEVAEAAADVLPMKLRCLGARLALGVARAVIPARQGGHGHED